MRNLYTRSSRANDSRKIIFGTVDRAEEFRGSTLAVAMSRARNSRVASACVAENMSPQLCDRVKARDASAEREDRLVWRLLRLANAKSLVSSSFMPWQSRVIRKPRRNAGTMRLCNVIYRKLYKSGIFPRTTDENSLTHGLIWSHISLSQFFSTSNIKREKITVPSIKIYPGEEKLFHLFISSKFKSSLKSKFKSPNFNL